MDPPSCRNEAKRCRELAESALDFARRMNKFADDYAILVEETEAASDKGKDDGRR
jgi:hypothetical protein